jgi:AcrR family transcriptional regulator
MKHSTRQSLLQAARRVVAEQGVAALTLDAVAQAAGVSKGGLLYHFPSKDKLIEGMIEHLIGGFEAELSAELARDSNPGAPGSWARAYARASCAPDAQSLSMSTDLLAAIAIRPELLDPLRARYAEWQRQLEHDGIDPAIATIVRLAADGLWVADMFGAAPIGEPLRGQVLAALLKLTQEQTL